MAGVGGKRDVPDDAYLAEIAEGLARAGREIDRLTAELGKLNWEREQLMFAAWERGVNVRLIAQLAKCSRTVAQQVAERHASPETDRRQDRNRSARIARIAQDRGLIDDTEPFYRRGRPLGDVLRSARRRKGLTQERMADLAGIDRAACSRIENGDRYPPWRIMVKIANILDLSPDEIAEAVESDPAAS